MKSELVRAEPSQLAVLRNLFQLYVYDFSEIMPLPLGDDGRFAEPRRLDAFFGDDARHPFLIRVDGRWAGFALVERGSRIDQNPTTYDVAEFFVLRGLRRTGVGEAAATALFDAFRGRWEVRQTVANVAATAFWRRVVSRYTKGRFTEVVHASAQWHGPVQSFVTE